jgi:hypothetical protein
MEQVWRSLEESEEKVTKLEQGQKDLVCRIQLDHTEADINNADKQLEQDKYISCQFAELDKASQKELSDLSKRIEKEQIVQLKKALSDQRALFNQLIANERAVANVVLQKTQEEYDEIIKNEREIIDSLNNQANIQLFEWKNDYSKLKSLIENFTPLIQLQEARGNISFKVTTVL